MGRTRHFETGLTPRQKEVLRLIEKGHTNGEIAEKLGITLAGAKWHVSELLSKFGATTREDLAEIMERERRSPGDRVKGWMAGLTGLVPVKLTGTSLVVAAGGAAAAIAMGGAVIVFTGDSASDDAPPDVAALLPDDPGDSLFSPEEAYAIAAVEAARLIERLDSSAGRGLDYELVEAKWLPSSVGFWFRSFGRKWESANREVFDLWAFRWELVDRSVFEEDGHVTVLVSDGDSIPLDSVGVLQNRRTGTEITFTPELASLPPAPPPPPQPFLLTMNAVLVGQVRTLGVLGHPWCTGGSGASQGGQPGAAAECPLALPEHEPIRLYLHTSNPVDAGATLRTLHVAYRYPIARVVAHLDNGESLELPGAGQPTRALTLFSQGLLPPSALPTEVIGYDSDGNEVGRRAYPQRPMRP